MRDKQLAIETARVLSRMTGDKCAAMWHSVNTFVIARQTPEGKMDKG